MAKERIDYKKLIDRTILVVEDERPLLHAIKVKLENNGYEVVTARSANQALSYIEVIDSIHAIWLDHYLLGKRDGLDLVAHVKSHEQWRDIPIFIVSNTATPEKERAYMELGVVNYFVKANTRLDNIIGRISNYFEEHPILEDDNEPEKE